MGRALRFIALITATAGMNFNGALLAQESADTAATARPVPALYQRIAHKHGVDPVSVYRAALKASGRPLAHGKALLPWPWTLRLCRRDGYCEQVFLDNRETMFAVLQAAQDAGLTLFVGPLGLRWEPSDRLPLRAATQPRVTINEAVRRLRAKAQGPVGDSAGFRRVDAPRSVKPIFNTAQARRYTPLIAQVALSEGVEPALVHAIVAVESAYNPQARSSAGAVGLMQLMPATAERFGLSRTERTHPAKNLRAGIRYLKFLNRTFDGNLALMLAGYNAGENAVLKYHRQIPPYRETQNYVRKVQRFYARYTPTKGAS